MACPDCGYLMTAFDKECPRCRNLGKPQKSCLKCGTTDEMAATVCRRCSHQFGDPVEPLPAEPSPTADTPPRVEPPISPSWPPPPPAPAPRRFRPWQIIGGLALVLVAGSALLGIGSGMQADQQQKQAAADKQALIDQNKTNGLQQCIAGDVEGCHYSMDKLRDAGATEDAEFLKAHIIVCLSLADKKYDYRANGGATSAEYAGYAKLINDKTFLRAYQGDPDYRDSESAADTATYLSQYGISHKLTGRY